MINVMVNTRSGCVAEHGVDHIRALFSEAVPDARLHVLDPHDDLDARCREFRVAGATCIAAVGGDGTVSAVAAALVHTPVSLGVVPGGTLNHFARDVGVGRDVPAAIQTLARGHTAPVDVATVNDRVFLNNSSVGLYPDLVDLRAAGEQRFGKWRAMVRAGLLVMKQAEWIDLEICADGETHHVRTRLLFVGNNQFELRLFHLG